MEADKKKLDQSGFDLYQPTFATAGNARAVIELEQGEDVVKEEGMEEDALAIGVYYVLLQHLLFRFLF